jgi:hypothetical protein
LQQLANEPQIFLILRFDFGAGLHYFSQLFVAPPFGRPVKLLLGPG